MNHIVTQVEDLEGWQNPQAMVTNSSLLVIFALVKAFMNHKRACKNLPVQKCRKRKVSKLTFYHALKFCKIAVRVMFSCNSWLISPSVLDTVVHKLKKTFKRFLFDRGPKS